jgi:hypothetical protein
MTEAMESQGTEEVEARSEHNDHDPALQALTNLSEIAEAGANELHALNADLSTMKGHRRRGWTWRRIISAAGSPNPLSIVARVASDLSRANGALRRALARALRDEGMQLTDIGRLFGVTRQRVGALVRPDRSKD